MNQEILQKAMMLRQQSEETEKQLQFVSEQINELEQFGENLRVLGEDKEKEMLASIGKGVYVKTERNVEEKLFVEVGAGVLVKKTPAEARKIILGQVKKFHDARIQLSAQLEAYGEKFGEMMGEVEKMKSGK